MKRKVKVTGNLQTYLRWPVLLSVLLICMDISIFLVNRKAGFIMLIYVAGYIGVASYLFFRRKSMILGEIIQFAADYGQVQKQLLKELSLPYGILDTDGKLLWGNDQFMEIIVNESAARRSISNIFPDITKNELPKPEKNVVLHTETDHNYYKVVMRRITVNGFSTSDLEIGGDDSKEENSVIAIYLYDETEIQEIKKENNEQRLIVGLIYIDNYEEALESIDEVRRSLLVALVDRKINKYMQSIDAIVKKLEKDKYIVMFKQKYLGQMQSSRFALLDEVRAINIGNEMAVTLSFGIGVRGETYQRSYDYARAAIDLALGRGGDQAVVKEGDKISYYGGKSVQVEKSTRVKARVKAHALKELVEAKEKLMVMGHSIGDVDSLGAAIGIYRIAKTLGKKVHIVINEITTSVSPVIHRFMDNGEYEEDMFLNSSQALEAIDNNTLLVVVDVNRPSYTECPELLKLAKTIVLLDHHRQGSESIDNAVLSYIEPYASSTCEMVAEILQYISDNLKLKQAEADALYSGMMIDTDNFLTKTGVRTFEAAAYLRRNGADVTRVRKMFRSDAMEYKVRAESISNSEIFLEHYAISVCQPKGLESPTIVGAQAANQLLDIKGIKASFVLTEFNSKIYISARSIDEVNVQVVMERLGGGGHMSVAGAQMEDCTIEKAKDTIKSTLNAMIQEGEI